MDGGLKVGLQVAYSSCLCAYGAQEDSFSLLWVRSCFVILFFSPLSQSNLSGDSFEPHHFVWADADRAMTDRCVASDLNSGCRQ